MVRPSPTASPSPTNARSFVLHEILYRGGAERYVGGQEDMIVDIALRLQAERAPAGRLSDRTRPRRAPT
ncbi:hypothetical protein AB0F91_27025 [Amycolatopsis sp. NPDC023774]|uniref:hypothetical protein n=1 Tax=Amycolatopsis sp. NPDC023774 TaxID=3155015 RepID=UPI0033C30C76